MSDWVTVQPGLEPVMEKIDPVLTGITSILDFLIGILNIVQAILNVLKAFMVGLLSPIRELLEMIIEEVRGLIADLRQMGVYLTGDWDLLTPENQFSDLLGGYQAYERRMLARLLDKTDPTRPNFSQSSSVVGAFFYVSSQDIYQLMQMILRLMRFFGQENLFKGAPFGTPTAPTMKYGTAGAGVASFRKLAQSSVDSIPDSVSISWASPSPAGGLSKVYSPAPSGFLIHVSTIPDGFNVLGLTTKADVSLEVENLPRVQAVAIDPNTNGPVKLFGGLSDFGAADDSRDFSTVESDDPRAHALFLMQDQNTPLIKPSLLKGTSPLVADTFFAKTNFFSRTGPGTQYTATLQKDDLPLGVTFKTGPDGFAEIEGEPYRPNTYYIRVRSLSKDYTDLLKDSVTGTNLDNPKSVYPSDVRLFQFSRETLDAAQDGILYPNSTGDRTGDTSWGVYTPASSPGVAQFPNAIQKNYLNAAKAALAVAILCRADLSEADSDEFKTNTYKNGVGLYGLEQIGRDLFARFNIQPVLFKTMRPQQFRLKLRWALAQIVSELQKNGAPPDSVVQGISDAIETLSTFTWQDASSLLPAATILESIDSSTLETEGIGANPYCRSLPDSTLNYEYRFKDGLVRGPSFTEKPGRTVFRNGSTPWIPGEGSADYSPIVYSDSELFHPVEYARNVLVEHNEGEVIKAAVTVLQIATATMSRPNADTQWIAIRLMPQALAPLDDILASVDRYMDGILDGLQGVVDKIVAYIDAIQARIYQIQALLEQIKALLAALEFFTLPSASGLVLVESGTDGLVAGLVGSGNKPSDGATSYGGGVAIVAGGMPTVLLETIALILGGSDE